MSEGRLERQRSGGRRARFLLGAATALCLIAALVASRYGHDVATLWLTNAKEWVVAAGPVGWLLVALAQMLIAMIGVVPASLLGVAAGGFYGVWLGFALAAIGTLAGGTAAFVLARSLLRPSVERILRRRGESRLVELDTAVTRDGWRFVCLLRISLVMPFAITSYALGITQITLRDYLLGTLASLPALAGYVAFGALAQYGVQAERRGPLDWPLLGIGMVAAAALIVRSGALLARCGLLPGRRQP